MGGNVATPPPIQIFPPAVFDFLLRMPFGQFRVPTLCPNTHASMKTIFKNFCREKE